MAVMLRRYRFTVDEYERLAQAQLLTQCDRIELLDGEIVEMTPIGDRHASVVARLTNLFSRHLDNRSIVWAQNPIQLRIVRSMPQPDVVLVRPRADFYAAGKPGPDDVLLLIEVMDTSAETDRSVKLPLYARAGIVEAWLLAIARPRPSNGTNGWRLRPSPIFRSPSPTSSADLSGARRRLLDRR